MGVTGDFSVLARLGEQLKKIATPEARIDFSRNLAEEYRDFMMECFAEGRSPYGQSWAPLKFRHSVGGAGQKPLNGTGLMKGAATPVGITVNGFRVQVGKIYASTHQRGATIVPKNAKALRFRGGLVGSIGGRQLHGVAYVRTLSKSGRATTKRLQGGFIFVKKVVIPARPFAPIDGIPPELDQRVHEAADDFIQEYLA